MYIAIEAVGIRTYADRFEEVLYTLRLIIARLSNYA
jgi:hypothetical protein